MGIGESFMVVPPGSSSYMTSSMWGTGRAANNIRNTTSANRVQNMLEANIVRETMKRFKTEYGKRFASLRKALEKYRDGANNTENSPVTTSNYMQNAAVLDQLQHQEQLIRKLTIDLKKEKDGRKKKDSALRKCESFYREVKARSAQKAAQRQSTNSRNIPNRSTQR